MEMIFGYDLEHQRGEGHSGTSDKTSYEKLASMYAAALKRTPVLVADAHDDMSFHSLPPEVMQLVVAKMHPSSMLVCKFFFAAVVCGHRRETYTIDDGKWSKHIFELALSGGPKSLVMDSPCLCVMGPLEVVTQKFHRLVNLRICMHPEHHMEIVPTSLALTSKLQVLQLSGVEFEAADIIAAVEGGSLACLERIAMERVWIDDPRDGMFHALAQCPRLTSFEIGNVNGDFCWIKFLCLPRLEEFTLTIVTHPQGILTFEGRIAKTLQKISVVADLDDLSPTEMDVIRRMFEESSVAEFEFGAWNNRDDFLAMFAGLKGVAKWTSYLCPCYPDQFSGLIPRWNGTLVEVELWPCEDDLSLQVMIPLCDCPKLERVKLNFRDSGVEASVDTFFHEICKPTNPVKELELVLEELKDGDERLSPTSANISTMKDKVRALIARRPFHLNVLKLQSEYFTMEEIEGWGKAEGCRVILS